MNLLQKYIFGFLVFVFGFIVGGIISFCSADGIYHNADLGLISIVYNSGTNVLTLSDKNLGATGVDSYGYYYQFGNNYPFDFAGSYDCADASSVSIDLSSYGPGNYFNSNGIFYTDMSSSNYNIWGGVDGTFSAMQGPCPNGYHIIDNRQNISDIFTTYFGFSASSSFPYLNYLKMPLAGFLNYSDGCYRFYGTYGEYRASTSSTTLNGSRISFESTSNHESWSENKSYGMSLRCFKNESVSPTYLWDRLYGDVITPSADITVLYNNGDSSTVIQCDGDNIIQINGNVTLGNGNVFTPYIDITYRDEDNQLLTESYSKSNLYLEDGLFKKTFTGDNDWILTNKSACLAPIFSGYIPSFDVTGTIESVTESGNIFNNFAENSLKVLLSNIPSYIQYVIMFILLLFILSIIRRFKRR